MQFQFHEGLCNAIKHKGLIHECDIYQNKKAGKQFSDMLKMGKSKTWQEALNVAYGKKTKLNGKSLLDYFDPLMQFLNNENKNKKCDW